MATINLDKGARITTFAPPPSDFDPLTASLDDLARFGLPRRPDDPQLLARYRSVFTRLKGTVRYIEPAFKVDTAKTTHIQPAKTTAGTETSDNWSGGVGLCAAGPIVHLGARRLGLPERVPANSKSSVLQCQLDRYRWRRVG